MKINSILVKSIIQTFNVSEKELQDYFKEDNTALKNCKEISHEYMMDAALFFSLLQKLRAKEKDIQKYYTPIYKLNVLDLGLFGGFLLSCKNMHVVHDKLEKYQMMIFDFVEFKYRCVQNEIFCGVQVPYGLIKTVHNLNNIDCIIDFELIYRHRILESIIGGRIIPKRIMIKEKYYSAERFAALKELFGCDIIPNNERSYNEIVYSAECVSKGILYNNYTTYHLLEPLVENHLKKLYNDDNYHRIIKRILMNNLHNFPLTLEEVSQRLHMSVRKLQKILQSENTSYQKVCNDMKQETALLYLSRGYKVKDIAFKLGYKESNSFTRSFKTWFNLTPDDYKEQMQLKNNGMHLAVQNQEN